MAQHFWLTQRALILQEQCFRPKLAMQEADDERTGRLVPVVRDQEERTGRLVPVVRDQDRNLALYLRHQTTHDRAFRQVTDELRKTRNEKRKHEIGFESQKQREAHEIRKQEMHEARLRPVNSKADHNEIDNDIRQTIEAPLPGHMRILFDTMKTVFSSAVDQVNGELKAAQAA
jgi:hypothetical protein